MKNTFTLSIEITKSRTVSARNLQKKNLLHKSVEGENPDKLTVIRLHFALHVSIDSALLCFCSDFIKSKEFSTDNQMVLSFNAQAGI